MFTFCVCMLAHTTTHMETRGRRLIGTSSLTYMSSGKQTQASKQQAPLSTGRSSGQIYTSKSIPSWEWGSVVKVWVGCLRPWGPTPAPSKQRKKYCKDNWQFEATIFILTLTRLLTSIQETGMKILALGHEHVKGARSWDWELPCVYAGWFVASLQTPQVRLPCSRGRQPNPDPGWQRPPDNHLCSDWKSRPPQEANRYSMRNIPGIEVPEQTTPSPHNNQDPCSREGLQSRSWHRPSACVNFSHFTCLSQDASKFKAFQVLLRARRGSTHL